MSWNSVQIKEACSLITDGTHYTPPDIGQGMPFLTVKDVSDEALDFDGCSFISDEEFNRADLGNSAPKEGDILFSKDGTVGKVFVVDNERPFAVLSSLAILRPNHELLDSAFFGHVLRSPNTLRQASKSKTGSAIRRIILNDLKQVKIPLPPLPEQKRIAAILDKADAIRRKRRQALALADQLLQSAFLWLVGPKHPDYASWPQKTIESLAEAPTRQSMRTGPFGSALKHSEFVDEGIAVLGIDNAVQNRFAWSERRFITEEKYEDLKRYTVKPNDVLITIMGTTGRSAVVPDSIPVAISTKHLATITVDRTLSHPEFISNAIYRHPGILRQIAVANRGAIMSGLNLGIIKSLELHVPPLPLQLQFASTVQTIRDLEGKMDAIWNRPNQFFESLTQRAFRGEL